MPYREARSVAESDRTGRNPGMTRLVRRSSSGVWRYCVFLSFSNIKYRTIYRISQELINETIESMNSRIADIIRNNGEKLKSIKVPLIYRHSGAVLSSNDSCTFLWRFTTNFIRFKVVFGRFKTVFDDFGGQWNKQWTKSFFYCPATKPCH